MPSFTSRLKLIKQAGTEKVKVADLNTNFDTLDDIAGIAVRTSTTRPLTPFDGQLIRETDTRRVLVWDAGQGWWTHVAGPRNTVGASGGFTPAFVGVGVTAGVLGPSSVTLTNGGEVDIWIYANWRGSTPATNWAANLMFDWSDVVGAVPTYVTKHNFRFGNAAIASQVGSPINIKLQNVQPGQHMWRLQLQNDAGSGVPVGCDAVGNWEIVYP